MELLPRRVQMEKWRLQSGVQNGKQRRAGRRKAHQVKKERKNPKKMRCEAIAQLLTSAHNLAAGLLQ
jgi:hypothetical protein